MLVERTQKQWSTVKTKLILEIVDVHEAGEQAQIDVRHRLEADGKAIMDTFGLGYAVFRRTFIGEEINE